MYVYVCACFTFLLQENSCKSSLFTNTRKIFKVQAREVMKKAQVFFLEMRQNYVTKHYWRIHQFHLFSKTLHSSRKASISFAYLILQLLLLRRTQRRGLDKMTNQKSSKVSKAPSRESSRKLLLSFCPCLSPGIICLLSSPTLSGLPGLLDSWCAFLSIGWRSWSAGWCQHLWVLNKENLDICWMPVWRQVGQKTAKLVPCRSRCW